MKKYVLGFLLDRKNRVALIRKQRPDWQKGRLNGIGGHIEENEFPNETMVREFEEETGHRHKNWKYFQMMTGPGWNVWIFYDVVDDLDDLGLRTTTDEAVEITPLSRLFDEDVIQNLPWIIGMIRDKDDIDFKFIYN